MDAMPVRDRHGELRDFLRSRRARLTPADVGLPAIAGALRLAEPERAHLYRLAGLNPPESAAGTVAVDPAHQRLLAGWLPNPAYLLDRHWNFLALNTAAREVFGYRPGLAHNCLITFFTSADCRVRWPGWVPAAADMVADFRAQSARFPDDARFAELAADLAGVSPEFAELWARHEVWERSQGSKTVLTLPELPGTRLILHLPAAGTATADRLSQVLAAPVSADSG
ncbi:hypothetical protein HNR67_004158 [Crossiella cryophila]|uniref:MmyB-like transcription regulator ligand binding domain-containing protein n=2 Tax=Crossiella cryophila TaxID=43355 RepID=A0A7W7CBE1_9PSEU|nr:hypothetical protein [Crossiella cryophila]